MEQLTKMNLLYLTVGVVCTCVTLIQGQTGGSNPTGQVSDAELLKLLGIDPSQQGQSALSSLFKDLMGPTSNDPASTGQQGTQPGTQTGTNQPGTDPSQQGTDPNQMGTNQNQQGTNPTQQGTNQWGTNPNQQGTQPNQNQMGTNQNQQGTQPTQQGTNPTQQGTNQWGTNQNFDQQGAQLTQQGTNPNQQSLLPNQWGNNQNNQWGNNPSQQWNYNQQNGGNPNYQINNQQPRPTQNGISPLVMSAMAMGGMDPQQAIMTSAVMNSMGPASRQTQQGSGIPFNPLFYMLAGGELF